MSGHEWHGFVSIKQEQEQEQRTAVTTRENPPSSLTLAIRNSKMVQNNTMQPTPIVQLIKKIKSKKKAFFLFIFIVAFPDGP